jgi:hypothetical protein
MPIAFVASIHFCGVSVKLFEPASILKASNSMPLNAKAAELRIYILNSAALKSLLFSS